MKTLDLNCPEEKCRAHLSEHLSNVDNRDFVWLDEILEEAKRIFKSSFEEQPALMPKTPSQKNRRKKKRFSTTKNDRFSGKRLLERDSNQSCPVLRTSKGLQQKNNVENASLYCRMTRSQAAKIANLTCKTAAPDLVKERIPLVEISNHERLSAELQIEKTPAQNTENVALASESSLDDKELIETVRPLSKASLLVIPDTPEAQIIKGGRSACKLKIANVALVKTTEKSSPQAEELLPQPQQKNQDSETSLPQNLAESAQMHTAPKASRQSVRRSLMGKTSMNKASLVQRCSLAGRRERAIRKSGKRSVSIRSTAREQSSTGKLVSCRVSLVKLTVEEIESGTQLDTPSHSQEVADQPFSHSLKVPKAAGTEEQPERETKENSSEKNGEIQEQPQSVRRKASYKRAMNELHDGHQTEDELSPQRKELSPQGPASKVVRPFKTFLHTVHKNQVLMMTPGSVSRNSTIKSFLKHNTPARTNPGEKERQRLENLKKKQEAEQRRKQKMEEEKRLRLEERKRKREEHLRKVLQAREQVEQREEEKKKLLAQKLAQHNEKVREEKMASAAKKAEELEARKQRVLQLEEKRKQQELMQRRKEEEQEKARQAAELEKKQAAERELEKKREQEKLQAQLECARKEKQKAAHLQRGLMAAKEKEQLQKEAEEKEKQRLQKEAEEKEKERLQKEAEEKERKLREEQEKEKSTDAVVGHKQLNVTIEIQNSPCSSYPMTPKGPKQPKFEVSDYGMDLNSDDSTDDESQPRKPVPAWAAGDQLTHAIIHQYYNPPDTDAFFGVIKSPKLEVIFNKNKPRYQKRTSSAVWNSPPFQHGKSMAGQSWQGLKRC